MGSNTWVDFDPQIKRGKSGLKLSHVFSVRFTTRFGSEILVQKCIVFFICILACIFGVEKNNTFLYKYFGPKSGRKSNTKYMAEFEAGFAMLDLQIKIRPSI